MPSKYIVRNFKENSIYHIYNRGVEKRQIFNDDQDFRVFLFYLNIYTSPLKQVLIQYPDLPSRLKGKNLSSKLNILGYCLLQDHFHILLEQKTTDTIPNFMKQVINGYTLYFNQKYKRSGSLMQGRYKAVAVNTDQLLLLLLRHLHLEPVILGESKGLNGYKWSSYLDYLDKPSELACTKKLLLSLFPSKLEFESFHADQNAYTKELDKIRHLKIESDP